LSASCRGSCSRVPRPFSASSPSARSASQKLVVSQILKWHPRCVLAPGIRLQTDASLKVSDKAPRMLILAGGRYSPLAHIHMRHRASTTALPQAQARRRRCWERAWRAGHGGSSGQRGRRFLLKGT
jgi:hypothetical protein